MKKMFLVLLATSFVFYSVSLNANDSDVKMKENSIIVKFSNEVITDKTLENGIEATINEDVRELKAIGENNYLSDIVEVETYHKVNIRETIAELEKRADIEYAQPNYIYKALDIKIMASECDSSWYLDKAHLDASAAKNRLKGKNTINVGVIDSGVNGSHKELKSVYNSNLSYDFIKKTTAQKDENNHGTHVAGIIAGKSVGVGTNIKIVSYRVLDKDGYGLTADAAKAIKKANKDGVRILNMSFGAYVNDKILYQSIAEYNGIVVAASGNESYGTSAYPARYDLDNIISVGAIKSSNTRAKFSNYNPANVDLYAYGENINSSIAVDNAGIGYNDLYGCFSGTSMATPMVSASVAMNLIYNPGASNQQLKAAIMDGATYSANLKAMAVTSGYLNVNKSLDIIGNPTSNVGNPKNKAKHNATLTSTKFSLTGDNAYGQLGNGSALPFAPNNISKYYLTLTNTYVITKNGDLYVAGANNVGQLGNTSYSNTNRFIKFPKVVASHKFIGLDFRNSVGLYDENSLVVYLKYGKNNSFYKLGSSGYKFNSSSRSTTKNIQFVTYDNNHKRAIYYYDNAKKIVKKELYSYNSTTGQINTRALYSYGSTKNIAIKYSYTYGAINKYLKVETNKKGKRLLYNLKTYTIKKTKTKSGYTYSSINKVNDLRKYNNGVILSRQTYQYNKYGKLALKNGSNAKYSTIAYKSGKLINQTTYKYSAKGKKVVTYKKVITYKNGKATLKKEYYYNSAGKLRSGAYLFQTTYKNGKANKTYRYSYNDNGKAINKQLVKTRK